MNSSTMSGGASSYDLGQSQMHQEEQKVSNETSVKDGENDLRYTNNSHGSSLGGQNNNQNNHNGNGSSSKNQLHLHRDLQTDDFATQCGLLRSQVVEAKNELELLTCAICYNILFKPISCSECTQSFCKICIDRWLDPPPEQGINNNNSNNHSYQGLIRQPDQAQEDEEDDDDNHFLFYSQRVNGSSEGGQASEVHPLANIDLSQINNYNGITIPFDSNQQNGRNNSNCPHCKKTFKGIKLPLINKLLGSMRVRCFYQQNGCEEVVGYDGYEKHVLQCDFCVEKCRGCQDVFVKREISEHENTCFEMTTKCEKCDYSAKKRVFQSEHTDQVCLETQLCSKDKQISKMAARVDRISAEVAAVREDMQRLWTGAAERINTFEFETVFTKHFAFTEKKATLKLPSFNESKKKFDFLHSFLKRPFFVHSPLLQMFKIRFDKLQGNVLLGVSDSQLQNSLDFMVNKQGEIKKKEKLENKYKQKDRVANFAIHEKHTILVKYIPFMYTVEFFNIDLNVACRFDSSYLLEFNQHFFFFFSLDHQADSISFSPC